MNKTILFIFILLMPTTLMSSEFYPNDSMFHTLDLDQDGQLSRIEFDMFEYELVRRTNGRKNFEAEMESVELSAFEVTGSSTETELVDDDWLPEEWLN